MAKLDTKSFDPTPYGVDFSDYDGANRLKMNAMFKSLTDKSLAIDCDNPKCDLTGALLSFPVADGKAVYLVTKQRPLTLQHIPYGDAYRVLPPMIKGIDRSFIIGMLQTDKMLAGLSKRV